MKFIKTIIRGGIAFAVILLLLTIAINNPSPVTITLFGDYRLERVPLFIVIFLSCLLGSVLNLLFFLFNFKKKR